MKRAAIPVLIAVLAALVLFLFGTDGFYPWAKAIHVIAVVSWMAGVLCLPMLLAYHAGLPKGSPASETFKVMERRLLRAIMTPAMIVTWIFGLWLAWKGFGFAGGWLHAKIGLVVCLSAIHGYLTGAVRKFADDANARPASHWRILNAVQLVLIAGIVALVIAKPF